MPKSRVRKHHGGTGSPAGGPSGSVSRTPVKVKGPSSTWYVVLMLGFMLAGLVWLVVYYLAGPQIAWLDGLGAWNFLIGFGLWIVGLLMTLRWR
ncbi:cell division protein CrgA [Lolliginicoccus levis]|uniref:cell division protein CrgA n=1 Tax=Lolliginicoccus levis TaxID=2919542 RepID=UPI00241C5DDD|nr:cell division protein CrgA [Lolliginicoccus levis]